MDVNVPNVPNLRYVIRYVRDVRYVMDANVPKVRGVRVYSSFLIAILS